MDFMAMLQRVVRAVTFDLKFYNEAEDDTSLNREALIVVILVAILSAIGAIWSGFGAMVLTAIMVVVGYYALAYIALLVGVNFFHGEGTIEKLLRPLGYALAPNALSVLGVIPWCTGPIIVVGGLWALACSFVAIREALELDTTKAAITTAAGLLVWWILQGLIYWIF